MIARTALRRASLLGKSRAFASIGDKAPDVGLDVSFPGPKEVNFAQRCKGRRVILLGLPGAFTPTWSTKNIPGYLAATEALAEKNIDEVIISAVNDAAVMGAWAKAQDIDDNDKRFSERYVARQAHKVTMLADSRCELAKALDLVLDHPNNLHDLGGPRMKRFAAFYDDGVLKALSVAEGPKGSDGLHSDPAGDDAPESTFAENFLKTI